MSERRRVPRYMCELPARLSTVGTSEVPQVTVSRLAVGGCLIHGTGIPAPRTPCEFQLEWQGREIRAQAEVAWKNAAQNSAGIRFLSIDETSTASLRAICATLRLQPLTHMPEEEE